MLSLLAATAVVVALSRMAGDPRLLTPRLRAGTDREKSHTLISEDLELTRGVHDHIWLAFLGD